MIAIVTVDDRMGMTFNHRRVSRDKVVLEKILSTVAMSPSQLLWMNTYSNKLFETYLKERCVKAEGENHGNEAEKMGTDATIEKPAPMIQISDTFLAEASEGEYCFVEDLALSPYKDKIEVLLVFCWNRAYPSDQKLDLDLSSVEWELTEILDFPGNSHDTITQKTYTKIQEK